VANLRRRALWLAGGLVVAGWLALCAALAFSAGADMNRGINRVDALDERVVDAESLKTEALPQMRQARASFDRASSRLDSHVLAPLRILPVVGRQVRSVDALSGSAKSVLDTGIEALGAATAALERPRSAGRERVDVLEELAGIAGKASADIAHVGLGPSKGLVGPVDDLRDRVAEELGRARRGVRKLNEVSAGLSQLLRGPRRYLVLAANNAEMRAGAGMPLSHGLATFQDGGVSMGGMDSVVTLGRPAPGLAMDPDLAAIWGMFKPNEEWRNVNMTPRFPASADLAARMFASVRRQPVDGVLLLDPLALRAILRTTGPLPVPGGTVDAENVLHDLFYEQYLRPIDRIQRRDRLSDIAAISMAALNRPVDVARLGHEMLKAVQGRHMMAWSSRPDDQRVWDAADMDGDLTSDSLMVSVINRGASKLDQFLKINASLEGGERGERSLSLRLHNESKPDAPPYVLGSFRELGLPPGAYEGMLSINLPGGSEIIDAGGLTLVGPDGRSTAVLMRLRLLPDEERQIRLRFRPPSGLPGIWVEPSARFPGIAWRSGSLRWTDTGGRALRF
jgi:hypothetical protein